MKHFLLDSYLILNNVSFRLLKKHKNGIMGRHAIFPLCHHHHFYNLEPTFILQFLTQPSDWIVLVWMHLGYWTFDANLICPKLSHLQFFYLISAINLSIYILWSHKIIFKNRSNNKDFIYVQACSVYQYTCSLQQTEQKNWFFDLVHTIT